jgi:hypothetical protein
MQVNLYQKNIDQHLSSALEKGGTNGSGFKWYLATQVYDVALYHPKNSDECEGLLPYPSINLPTAPKANFYAQDSDYQESCKQQEALSKSKHPEVRIHFMNCIRPQCLNYLRCEQLISSEVIDNSPMHTQQLHGKQPLLSHRSNDNSDINQAIESNAANTNPHMPSNFFVDATLENTARSVDMIF